MTSARPSTATRAPGWLRRLWDHMLVYRADMAVSMSASVISSVLQTVVPLIARQIVDNVILHHASPLWPWLTLLFVAAAGRFLFAYLRRYRGSKVALSVQYDLRNEMQEHLQAMDLANLDRMPTGQLVARVNSDSTLLQGFLMFFPMMTGNVLLLVFSLGVMFYLSPMLALVSVVLAPSVAFISYRMRSRIFPATWDAQQHEGEVLQIVDEDINGVRIVKAFGQEEHEMGRLVSATKLLFGSQLRAVRLQARYQPLLGAIPALAQVVILALGGWMALHHQISLGTFLAFSTYVSQFVAPARQLANVLTIAQQARAGAERIFQLIDVAPAIADAPDAVDLPDIAGEVTFSGVHFGYDDGPSVLRGFDLHIAAGERVAIVGPSGSGKTTAAMLVPRFYDPEAGTVMLDGHDVRHVTLASLRRQVGIAFEESFLFSDTVRANIAYGRPDATDAEVESAASAAQAHEFIMELPRGYNTVVGERGLTLSGGQRQRIALARAILSGPRVLVLDDATSSVDARVEESIHEALRAIMAGRTTLLIAHRRSTLHLADRIVVMEHGRVVEQGTHEQLVARSAMYRALLAGLDDEAAKKIGDRIEALSALASEDGSGVTATAWATSGQDGSGVTAAAWAASGQDGSGSGNAGPGTTWGTSLTGTTGAGQANRRAADLRLSAAGLQAAMASPGLGPGLGGGGGWRRNLAPTPELLAKVAALRPVRDTAVLDLATEAAPDPHFSLWRLLRQFRAPLALGLFLVVLDALAGLAGPFLVKTGIDRGVSTGSASVLFVASAAYLAFTVADLIVQIGETFVMGRAAQRIMLSLRVKIWAQLLRLSLDYYEREMAGRIMTRMTTDVDQFESLIENGLLSALVSIVTFVGVGVLLVVMNPELGACTLSVVVPLGFATVAFRNRSARTYDLARERIAILNADFQEGLAGARESQAFVHEQKSVEHYRHLGRDYLSTRLSAQRLIATYFPFVQMLSAVADAIVLGVGSVLVASGKLTSGEVVAFILYISMFFSPVQQLSQVFNSWQQTLVSMNRVSGLMRLKSLTPTAEKPITPGRLRGEIAFEDVHFSYPEARPRITQAGRRPEGRGLADPRLVNHPDAELHKSPEALRGINLKIGANETIALVGETGAGKSTLMKLMARFYDSTKGAVRADNYDLRQLDLANFRHQLGYVPQEPFLFSGSVRDNIAYGKPTATDAEVEAAARAVGAHDFIAELPGGYLHELAERGRSLSTGQRQLIALARAELVDPAVLLLDEATSNLDLVTEATVTAAMQRLSRDRTTVVIAHRLQTARSADRVVVLHHGRIVEVGSHDELLDRNGRYAAMWRAFELVSQAKSASDLAS
jgi:ATP-binding cassette subfamily B protein